MLSWVVLCQTAFATGKASHVVLIVWDGMRPDFVSEENTPTLFAAARGGVTFLHHHPVYPSTTEVNGTALATGVYPAQSTIIANDEYRPAIDPLGPFETQSLAAVRKGDKLWANQYIAFPTVSEILHDNGRRTAVAASKPVGLLHDRAPRGPGALGVTLFAGRTLPEQWQDTLTNSLGPFPAAGHTKTNIDQWTTRALTGPLWNDAVPAFSVLWLAEPDNSQHKYGPGAPDPLLAIKNDDLCLARVLQVLKEKQALDSTDIIVVSDHGFSTVTQAVDIGTALRDKGFHVFRKFSAAGANPGDILLVGLGGSDLCYVTGHDQGQVEQVVHCLQAQPFTGVIFSRNPVAGTFSLADAHLDSPDAPDLVVAMRWTDGKNQYGVPGMMYGDNGPNFTSKGSHGSLCPTEMHNTCLAFGPDFKPGLRDDLPTGNVDIAPTILWILGLTPQRPMSGRVLAEALTASGPAPQPSAPHHQEASWKSDHFVWRQYLDVSVVNGVTYFDQGNGAQEPVP
jgi:predicted AlkP superfamily pyrophosphatase or phosphodiesterase